jgi:hypothetical protein
MNLKRISLSVLVVLALMLMTFATAVAGEADLTEEANTLSVQLAPSHYAVQPGDLFYVRTYLENRTKLELAHIPMFALMEVEGNWYSWPSWRPLDPGETGNVLDFMYVDVPVGVSSFDLVPPFLCPDFGFTQPMEVRLVAFLTNATFTKILGKPDQVYWRWVPPNWGE